jgi:hypothetical protein
MGMQWLNVAELIFGNAHFVDGYCMYLREKFLGCKVQ